MMVVEVELEVGLQEEGSNSFEYSIVVQCHGSFEVTTQHMNTKPQSARDLLLYNV